MSPECGAILASRMAPCGDGWLAGLGGGGHNVPRWPMCGRGYFSKSDSPEKAIRPDGRQAWGFDGGDPNVPCWLGRGRP